MLPGFVSQVSPTVERGEKYSGEGSPLAPGKVAKLGRQILDVSTLLGMCGWAWLFIIRWM